jgi:hypothetical protein
MGYVPCLYKDSTNNILFFIDCSQVWVLIEGNKRVDVLVVECIGETCSCNVESSFLQKYCLCYPYIDMVHIPYYYNYLSKASAT